MRSHLEPMKKFVKLLHNHRDSLLNWFKSKDLSSGIVEGLNNKVKTTFKPSNATTDFEPKKHSKYRYITLLENYQNQNLPINFGEETFLCCIVY